MLTAMLQTENVSGDGKMHSYILLLSCNVQRNSDICCDFNQRLSVHNIIPITILMASVNATINQIAILIIVSICTYKLICLKKNIAHALLSVLLML